MQNTDPPKNERPFLPYWDIMWEMELQWQAGHF